MVLAIVLGGGLALMRLSQTAPVRWLAAAWVEFFRGFPLLLLIFFTFFALPKYGVDLSPYQALVLALALYNGAVLGEIFRAGILSLDRGQTEAAYAVGLSYWRTMFLVVIPQAVRRMVPAIVGQLVTLLKDTSLGFVITYEELLRRSRSTGEFFRNPLQATVVVACMYIAVNFTLGRIARWLEVRQRTDSGRRRSPRRPRGDDRAAGLAGRPGDGPSAWTCTRYDDRRLEGGVRRVAGPAGGAPNRDQKGMSSSIRSCRLDDRGIRVGRLIEVVGVVALVDRAEVDAGVGDGETAVAGAADLLDDGGGRGCRRWPPCPVPRCWWTATGCRDWRCRW